MKPLKDGGWFEAHNNPRLQEYPAQSGVFYYPIWHALEYVVKVSTQAEVSVEILVDIVNSIINYADENGERIENDRTDLQVIKIIGTFPVARLKLQHIIFMGTALKSEGKYGLIEQEIGQTVLSKLLDGGARELTLALLEIMFEAKIADMRIIPTMREYWLEDALKRHGQAIANLCGVEAAEIALAQIRALAAIDAFSLHLIQLVESDVSHLSHADYTELVVSFASSVFQFAEPDSIEETVRTLLQEPHTIIKRIALKAITDHYTDLKHLFWEWEGNPLDEVELRPEILQLLETRSLTFDENEMEQILQWIESIRY